MDAALEQAREYFLQGNAHFEAGRLAEARSCFEAALALAPGRASVVANLGITHFQMGQWHEAIPLLRQTTVDDPAQPDGWAFLGLSRVALAQWQPTVDSLARALALDPQRAALWLVYGQSQLRLGRVEPALQRWLWIRIWPRHRASAAACCANRTASLAERKRALSLTRPSGWSDCAPAGCLPCATGWRA